MHNSKQNMATNVKLFLAITMLLISNIAHAATSHILIPKAVTMLQPENKTNVSLQTESMLIRFNNNLESVDQVSLDQAIANHDTVLVTSNDESTTQALMQLQNNDNLGVLPLPVLALFIPIIAATAIGNIVSFHIALGSLEPDHNYWLLERNIKDVTGATEPAKMFNLRTFISSIRSIPQMGAQVSSGTFDMRIIPMSGYSIESVSTLECEDGNGICRPLDTKIYPTNFGAKATINGAEPSRSINVNINTISQATNAITQTIIKYMTVSNENSKPLLIFTSNDQLLPFDGEYNGDLGGIAGADEKCESAKLHIYLDSRLSQKRNKHFKAMIASSHGTMENYRYPCDEDGHCGSFTNESYSETYSENWVLKPNTTYINNKYKTLGTTNKDAIFDKNLLAPITQYQNHGIVFSDPSVWSALILHRSEIANTPIVWWQNSLNDCDGWTSSDPYTINNEHLLLVISGKSTAIQLFTVLSYGEPTSCSYNFALYCVEQPDTPPSMTMAKQSK